MTELQQLELILGPDMTFWVSDAAASFALSTPSPMRVEVTEAGGEYRWRVTHPDGTGYEADHSFRSHREAKDDLRRALTDRLATLRDS
jgi:hypothetical protein